VEVTVPEDPELDEAIFVAEAERDAELVGRAYCAGLDPGFLLRLNREVLQRTEHAFFFGADA
jgi:hypothetical protein